MQYSPVVYASVFFALSAASFNISEAYTISNWARKMSRRKGYSIIRDLAKGMKTDKGNSILVLLAFWLAAASAWILGFYFPVLALPGPYYIYITAGSLLVLSGMAVRRWSMSSMGVLFTHFLSVRENHKVVESGPYRYVRHPSYLGGLLFSAGLGVAIGNLASIAVLIALPFVAYALRMDMEENMLAKNLGRPYLDYKRRVKQRILPMLW